MEPRTARRRDESVEQSFETFYEGEIDDQVRRAVLLLGSNDLANDVVHDAFIQVYERWTNIEEPGPYLHRTVLNGCREIHRRRARQSRNSHRIATASIADPPAPDPLEDVLAKLPFNHRAAIVLKFYYALTADQIAEELACPAGSVGPWITRGLATMRRELS